MGNYTVIIHYIHVCYVEILKFLIINQGVTEDINPMDAIEEEHSTDDSDDCEEDIEETEFVPSAWDAQATPTKSALRSPEKSSKVYHPLKKNHLFLR